MGKDLLALRDDREEAKKYDDDVIRNYKVKHVHGSHSLQLVGCILIDLSFLSQLLSSNATKDLLALRDDREEAKKYDDDVIRNYKVKHVHGSDSL